MVVTETTLYTASRDALKSLLLANVTDPITGVKSGRRRWIYRFPPDTRRFDFSNLPLIVLSPADVSTGEILTLNNLTRDNAMVFEIEIWTRYKDENTRLDSISDEIIYAIQGTAGQSTLQDNNMYGPVILGSTTNVVNVNGQDLYIRLLRVDLSGIFGC